MADDYPKLLYLNMLGNNHFPVRTDTLNYFITFKLGQKYSSSCVKQKPDGKTLLCILQSCGIYSDIICKVPIVRFYSGIYHAI